MRKPFASFKFSKFVVIESLGPKEVSTGKILTGYVSSLDAVVQSAIPVEVQDCPSAKSLLDLLDAMVSDAKQQQIYPILHFECHGDEQGRGLVFANGELMRWAELASRLKELNLAIGFNLLAFFAACNAFYFIEEMKAIQPAPLYAVVAPTDNVDPSEVMRGAMLYYRTLFNSSDAGVALSALKAEKLSVGQWFGKTAEQWFEEVVVGYFEGQCSTKAIAERARSLYQQQSRLSSRQSVGKLKRGLHMKHRTFVDEYFQKCFCTSDVPANVDRFLALHQRVDRRVKEIQRQPGFRR